MIIEKKIAVELTESEAKTLSDCEKVIDKFIDKMQDFNLDGYGTQYDDFDKDELDELANKIHSLTTVCEAY